MLNGYIYTSALFALFMVVLGLLVFLRNTKQLVNRQFLTFTVFAALWLITNYIAGTSSVPMSVAAPSNHLVLAFAAGMTGALLAFIIRFSESKTKLTKPLVVLNAGAGILALTDLVVQGVNVRGEMYVIEFGPLAAIYFITMIINLVALLTILLLAYRSSKGVLKIQLSIILLSFAISMTGIIITNAILPAVFDNYRFTNAGTLLSAVAVAGIAYTIIKHKLFDIRLVVARSLAYVLVVAVLGVSYSLLSLTLLSRYVGSDNEALNLFLNTVMIIVAASTFTPLKRYFDRLTNRFFYQDAYDSQEFLNNFNKTLVATYDLNLLLHRSAAIIEANVKPDFVLFRINDTTSAPRRIIGAGNKPALAESDMSYVHSCTSKMRRKVIVTDELDSKHADLQQILQASNVSLILRLTARTSDEGIGYLLLGSKKSGNMYSSTDFNTLEIIANELVIAIQNALRTEEIENFNLTLQEKITEATRKLRSTNEKLKQMDEAKDDFISMASHQLRTPLTSVKGYISMVLEEDAGKINATQREMLGQAFFSSQRMVYLIADLLNVSRLKTGKFIIDRTLVQLDQIVEQELRQLQETAAARSLTLEFESPKQFPPMMLDETKTRQIIMNFVDNAIYYTPAGGHIKVKLIDKPNTIELRVEDNGIGVPKAEQAHLFTKFYRAGNARQARPDGTGLGLFMAKKVIVAQGGSLVFESQEGVGSAFGFIFSKTLDATDNRPDVKELPVSPVAVLK